MAKLRPYRCMSYVCKKGITNQLYQYLESDKDNCPFCGCTGSLKPLTVIHLLIEDPNGIIQGSDMSGQSHLRFSFACGVGELLKTMRTNHRDFPRHYTTAPEAATCLECLLEYGQTLTGSLFDVHKR